MVAACALPAPAPRDGSVDVRRVERAVWNAEPEPGLFRIAFDAARMAEVRRHAETLRAPEGMDGATVLVWALELEAERELAARGLCDGSAKLVGALDTVGGGASGIFKCRPPVF
jgi:hypothetical protein